MVSFPSSIRIIESIITVFQMLLCYTSGSTCTIIMDQDSAVTLVATMTGFLWYQILSSILLYKRLLSDGCMEY